MFQNSQKRLDQVTFELFSAAGNKVLLLRPGASVMADRVLLDHAEHVASSAWPGVAPEIYAILQEISGCWHARFWNPDRSPEKMCGNAMRSIALALFQERNIRHATVVTPHGPTTVRTDGVHSGFSLPISAIAVRKVGNAVRVDVGTPHLAYRCDDVTAEWIAPLGCAIATRAKPLNATFFSRNGSVFLARTFERGVGETPSCGTGAIAATIASQIGIPVARDRIEQTVDFLSGEQLYVTVCQDEAVVTLTGPCVSLGRVN
jgi:diaminopimelate epimerase